MSTALRWHTNLTLKIKKRCQTLDPVQQRTSVAVSAKHTELSCPNAHRDEEQCSGHAVSPLPRNFCGEQPTAGPGDDVGSGGGGGWMTACVACVCVCLSVCPRSFPKDGDLPLRTRSPTLAGWPQEQPGVPRRRAASPPAKRRERRPLRPAGPGTGPRPPPPPDPPLAAARWAAQPFPHTPGAPPEPPPGSPRRDRMLCASGRRLRPKPEESGRRGQGREGRRAGAAGTHLRAGRRAARRRPAATWRSGGGGAARRNNGSSGAAAGGGGGGGARAADWLGPWRGGGAGRTRLHGQLPCPLGIPRLPAGRAAISRVCGGGLCLLKPISRTYIARPAELRGRGVVARVSLDAQRGAFGSG